MLHWNDFLEKVPALDMYIYITDGKNIWINKPVHVDGVMLGLDRYLERKLKWSYVFIPDLPKNEYNYDDDNDDVLERIIDTINKLVKRIENIENIIKGK